MPLKNSALEVIKRLSKLREEFAATAAERKAYEEATKDVYTKDMPSLEQWKADTKATPVEPQGFAEGGIVADEDLSKPAFRSPMVLKRQEDRQDREAAKGIPLAFGRGALANTMGIGGDIEGILRMLIPGVSDESSLPNTEHFLKSLPLNQDTPSARAFGDLGSMVGNPVLLKAVAPLARAATTAGKAGARVVGEEFGRAILDNSGVFAKWIPEAAKPMYAVKPTNQLSGFAEAATRSPTGELMTRVLNADELGHLNNASVIMRRKSISDIAGPDHKFKSVHETGKTGAVSGAQRSAEIRSQREPQLFGKTGQTYGYISSDPLSTTRIPITTHYPTNGRPYLAPDTTINQYGPYAFELDPKYKPKTTITFDDSIDHGLGNSISARNILREGSDFDSVGVKGSRLWLMANQFNDRYEQLRKQFGVSKLPEHVVRSKIEEIARASGEDAQFADMMGRYNMPTFDLERLPRQIPRVFSELENSPLLPSEIYSLEKAMPLKDKLNQGLSKWYVESQIHGDVTPEHIKRLYDLNYEPSLVVEKKMKNLGIEYVPRPQGLFYDEVNSLKPKNMGEFWDLQAERGVLPDGFNKLLVNPDMFKEWRFNTPRSEPLMPIRKSYAEGGIVTDEDLSKPAFRSPMVLKRQEDRQDREAAKGIPLAVARGVVAGTAGMIPDIINLLHSIVPGTSGKLIPYDTEHFLKSLPLNQDTPSARAFGELGSMFGSSAPMQAIAPLAKAATTAGKAGARVVGEEFGRAILDNSGVFAKWIPEAAKPMYAVKPKGGNWMAGSAERITGHLKSDADPGKALKLYDELKASPDAPREALDMLEQRLPKWQSELALNNWIDQKLNKYIRNDLGTPEDSLLALADKWSVDKPALLAAADAKLAGLNAKTQELVAQRGVPEDWLTRHRQDVLAAEKERDLIHHREALHLQGDQGLARWYPEYLDDSRRSAGFPAEGFGKSPAAKAWEQVADETITSKKAKEFLSDGFNNQYGTVQANPWLLKVPPETKVHSVHHSNEFEFEHLADELRNAMNPESGLPAHLLMKYTDLPKKTMEDVVTRVADINAWRAATKAESDLALANNRAVFMHKDYPDQGVSWKQIRKPEALPEGWGDEGLKSFRDPKTGGKTYNDPRDKELKDALKYEGELMQHCVGSHCPDVESGAKQIFSLRDSRGQPHATIEVELGKGDPIASRYDQLSRETKRELRVEAMVRDPSIGGDSSLGIHNPGDNMRQVVLERFPEWADLKPLNKITEIKGRQNGPIDDKYLPMVQDFVKSGEWSDVRDVRHTGLVVNPNTGKLVTKAELEAVAPPGPVEPQGFARGGYVDYDPHYTDYLANNVHRGFAEGGVVELGNIDLKNRPVVKNADGSISTVRSIGVNVGGKEVLIPTVSEDGKIMSDDQAVEQYNSTGKHLGIFASREAASKFAEQLHLDQEKQYVKPKVAAQRPVAPLQKNTRSGFARGGVVSTYTEYNPALVGAMVHDLQEESYAN